MSSIVRVSRESADLAAQTIRRHYRDSDGWCAWHRTFERKREMIRWGECEEWKHASAVRSVYLAQQDEPMSVRLAMEAA